MYWKMFVHLYNHTKLSQTRSVQPAAAYIDGEGLQSIYILIKYISLNLLLFEDLYPCV